MREIKTKIYSFDELDSEAKKKVIERCRYVNVDSDSWHEWEAENIIAELDKYFIIDGKQPYFFSLFGQGEYAEINIKEIKPFAINLFYKSNSRQYRTLKRLLTNKDFEIHYNYKKGIYAEINTETGEKYSRLIKECENELKEYIQDTNKRLLNTLKEEYLHLTSDDTIAETIRLNGYEFAANGDDAPITEQ